MERRLGVAGDPVEDLLVGLDRGAGRRLAAVELGQRRLAEDPPGDADGLDPFAPVLVGREVVEAERRVDRGSVEVIFTEPRASEYIGPTWTW